MKITRIETIGLDEGPNILFVQVHTDVGLVGLGETFFGPRAVAGWVHEAASPYLLGKNPLDWVGGLSEARKIAAIAEANQLPIAPHDCTGPVVWTASVHLSIHAPNAPVQESVRAYYSSWYRELVTELPRVKRGYVTPPPGPGLGTALLPDLRKRADAHVQVSEV